jgi:hypothetical protein
MLPNITAHVIASSSVSVGPMKRMTIVESCSPRESKAFFDVMYQVAEKVEYARPVLMGIQLEEEKLVVILHVSMLVGLAKAMARERSDILMDLFATGDLQRILLPLT